MDCQRLVKHPMVDAVWCSTSSSCPHVHGMLLEALQLVRRSANNMQQHDIWPHVTSDKKIQKDAKGTKVFNQQICLKFSCHQFAGGSMSWDVRTRKRRSFLMFGLIKDTCLSQQKNHCPHDPQGSSRYQTTHKTTPKCTKSVLRFWRVLNDIRLVVNCRRVRRGVNSQGFGTCKFKFKGFPL